VRIDRSARPRFLIDEIAPDFRLEDAWALPAHGSQDEFGDLLEIVAGTRNAGSPSRAVRALFALRTAIGRVMRWDDDPRDGAITLADRLPAAARQRPAEPQPRSKSFRALYRTDDEWAAEIANRTVHGVLHLAWVPDPPSGGQAGSGDSYHGEMGVYVKPHGVLGRGYMAVIAPFRHHIVYPAMLRQFGRAWETRRP
jgi:Protein of unknown function (DUF2867)